MRSQVSLHSLVGWVSLHAFAGLFTCINRSLFLSFFSIFFLCFFLLGVRRKEAARKEGRSIQDEEEEWGETKASGDWGGGGSGKESIYITEGQNI